MRARNHSVLSAATLSLDRLEVQHDRGAVAISPRDQQGFAEAIRARVPGVTWDASAVAPAPARTPALWGLLIMPLALIAVLAYALYQHH